MRIGAGRETTLVLIQPLPVRRRRYCRQVLHPHFAPQASDVACDAVPVWALAAFALEHFDEEPDQAIERLDQTQSWQSADPESRICSGAM